MSSTYDLEYIKSTNLKTIKKNLVGDKIIYFNQRINDPETQTDGDGPWTTWNIEIECLEEIEDDFVSHIFSSNLIQGIRASLKTTLFPHHSKHYFSNLIETVETTHSSTETVDLKKIESIVGGYMRYQYMAAESNNVKLNFKLLQISSKVADLNKKIKCKYNSLNMP